MDPVALVKYNGDVEKTLGEAIKLIGGFKTLKSPLIIKPNISAGLDKTGYANTNLDVVEAFIRLVLEKNPKLQIRIVESDSEAKYADEAFEKFGYKDLEQRMRSSGFEVSLVNLSRSPVVSVKFEGLFFKNPELPSLLVDPKYFVSLAIAKTHGLVLVTGAAKNLFGLLPRKNKSFYHPDINDVIIDLNRIVKPDLCIVDARVGLEGWNGPKKKIVNAFIMGREPVSVDATTTRVMGLDPEKIRHLVGAEKYGLGSLHPSVVGESIDAMAVKFNQPSDLSPKALI